MTFEFACSEAQRRTRELNKAHHVYHTTGEITGDGYVVLDRVLQRGFSPVYSIFEDGSEIES